MRLYGGHEVSAADADGVIERLTREGRAVATASTHTSWRTELEARQTSWRERQGHSVGLHKGKPLGWRLAMPDAERYLWNFLTPAIGELVRAEYLANASRSSAQKKLYGYPRLFDNLLSSQPMVFNLFGELALHLDQATLVCRRLWPERVDTVTRIEFEWSPGRQAARYLNNGSAADVALFHTTPGGGSGVIFIETKYYEDSSAGDSSIKANYLELANGSRAFIAAALPTLQRGKLQQLWLDHLLLLATRETDGHESALFVVAYPEINERCNAAVIEYQAALAPGVAPTFEARTLEALVSAFEEVVEAQWVGEFRRRYLEPTATWAS
jgi:hypothetical protein